MVDGNVSFRAYSQHGGGRADILVAGTSSWFNSGGSLTENVRKTEEAIVAGLKMRKRCRRWCCTSGRRPRETVRGQRPGVAKCWCEWAFAASAARTSPNVRQRDLSFPTICGHEFAGTVEGCGAEVADYRPGDRVVVFPLLWCGRCTACERVTSCSAPTTTITDRGAMALC